jgi:hypothetical protein
VKIPEKEKIPNGAEEEKSKETEKISGKRDKCEDKPEEPRV